MVNNRCNQSYQTCDRMPLEKFKATKSCRCTFTYSISRKIALFASNCRVNPFRTKKSFFSYPAQVLVQCTLVESKGITIFVAHKRNGFFHLLPLPSSTHKSKIYSIFLSMQVQATTHMLFATSFSVRRVLFSGMKKETVSLALATKSIRQ